MIRVLALSMLLLSGCASIPQWSDNPQDCKPPEIVDVVTIAKQIKRKYICVNDPEVVSLPSYLQLLELPPAEKMPKEAK